MEDLLEQSKNNDRPWLFKKGQSGNPNGRPKGTFSLKEYAKKMLANMTEDERQEFLAGLDKKTIWEMAEGKPETKTDVTSGGQPLTVQIVSFKDSDENNDTA